MRIEDEQAIQFTEEKNGMIAGIVGQEESADFPNPGKYYNLYMMREIGANEFAEEQHVSRLGLKRLIEDSTKKRLR